MILPDVKGDSALLPTDKWILSSVIDTIKSSKTLKREAAAGLGLGVLALGAVITVPALTITTALAGAALGTVALTAGAALFAAAAVIGGGALLLKRHFIKNGMKEFKEGIGKRYIKFKGDELMSAWNARRAEYAVQKKNKTAASKPDAVMPDDVKPDAGAEQTIVAPVTTAAAPEKAKDLSSAPEAAGAFGKWAMKRLAAKKPSDAPSLKDLQPKPPQP